MAIVSMDCVIGYSGCAAALAERYTWIAPILTLDRAFFSLDKRVESFEQAWQTFG